MEQMQLAENLSTAILGERRKTERHREMHLLVVTGRGTGKIVDIGREGLSFGCLYPHAFPKIWTLDILNARGFHLRHLTVRKIWQRTLGDPDLSAEFEMEVGVEFVNLSASQETALNLLLNNLCTTFLDSLPLLEQDLQRT